MSRSVLEDAFAHHVWATLRSVDACLALSPEQLGIAVPGTYGSILETVRHLVGADFWYLFAMTGGRTPLIDEDHMDLPELRAAMEGHGAAWSGLLAQDLDPDAVTVRRREDGSKTHAPMGIRLAQALRHGTDHRSQFCTVLTTLGVEPRAIDVWDIGAQDGRVVEIPLTSDLGRVAWELTVGRPLAAPPAGRSCGRPSRRSPFARSASAPARVRRPLLSGGRPALAPCPGPRTRPPAS